MEFLLVDDDKNDIAMVRPRLEHLGFNVSVRMIVDFDGLNKLNKERKPEVIQLDGLDGKCFELYDIFKSGNPESNIFICSGDDDIGRKSKEMNIHFIHKGMNYVDDIVDYVTPFIEKKRALNGQAV